MELLDKILVDFVIYRRSKMYLHYMPYNFEDVWIHFFELLPFFLHINLCNLNLTSTGSYNLNELLFIYTSFSLRSQFYLLFLYYLSTALLILHMISLISFFFLPIYHWCSLFKSVNKTLTYGIKRLIEKINYIKCLNSSFFLINVILKHCMDDYTYKQMILCSPLKWNSHFSK